MQTLELELQIEGSTGNAYRVCLARQGSVLKTSCTCKAGLKGTHCKHRLSLFKGDLSKVQEPHSETLKQTIEAMLQGTDVQSALKELASAEAEVSDAEDKLRRAKRTLDRAMHQ